MKKYSIEVKLDAFYENIEAETREEAIEKAIEWFQECEPEVEVIKIEEE